MSVPVGRKEVNSMEDFKITLKAARVNANLFQEEAAKELGISKVTLIAYESGTSSPTMEMAEKMSKLYRVPLDVLSFARKTT